MKTSFTLFLASACLLAAQDKPKDPFIKDKKAAASPAAAPAQAGKGDDADPPAKSPTNVRCFLETFTLPQADYAALIDGPDGRDKLYPHTLAAVKAGTARLDGCHLALSKSSTRTTLQCADELIYPVEWTPADRAGFQYPAAFEMRPLGDEFEFEPTLDEEKNRLNLNHAFTRNRLFGLRLSKADTTVTGVPVPDIFMRGCPSTCWMIPGLPKLIGTLQSPQAGDITLVFATCEVLTLSAPKAPAAKMAGNLILTARVISLDRMTGWELLKKHGKEGAPCLGALKPLLADQSATLEHVVTITTESGTRALHESGIHHHYGVEFSPPTERASGQLSEGPKTLGTLARPGHRAGTTRHETRPLGFRLEVEPVRSEDGAFADLTLAPEHISMTGNLKDKNWSEHYPEVPLFTAQKTTTGYTHVIGTTSLIGTMNPPGDTGANEHKDENRLWLLFMDVNQE